MASPAPCSCWAGLLARVHTPEAQGSDTCLHGAVGLYSTGVGPKLLYSFKIVLFISGRSA